MVTAALILLSVVVGAVGGWIACRAYILRAVRRMLTAVIERGMEREENQQSPGHGGFIWLPPRPVRPNKRGK